MKEPLALQEGPALEKSIGGRRGPFEERGSWFVGSYKGKEAAGGEQMIGIIGWVYGWRALG